MNWYGLYSSIIALKINLGWIANTLYWCSKSMVLTITKSNKRRAAIVYLYCLAITSSVSVLPKSEENQRLPFCYSLSLSTETLYVRAHFSEEIMVQDKLLFESATLIQPTTVSAKLTTSTKGRYLTLIILPFYSCPRQLLKLSTEKFMKLPPHKDSSGGSHESH